MRHESARRALAGLTFGAVFVCHAWAAQTIDRRFGDWRLVCDNLRRCTAYATADDAGGEYLAIRRDGGRPALISLWIGGLEHPAVDARTIDLGPGWKVDRDNSSPVATTSDADSAQRLVDLIRSGERLTDARANANEHVFVSLRGLTAALLAMDEAQGLLDTPGAWIRRGDRIASPSPLEAPAVPRAATSPAALSDAQATRLAGEVRREQAGLLRREDCASMEGREPFDSAVALTAGDALVFLECWPGAYQSSSLVFRVPRRDPGAARRMTFESYPGAQRIDILTNAGYDPSSAELSHFAKGRGLGDCGEGASWIFDGRAFRLVSYLMMESCAGMMADAWPTYWRVPGALSHGP